jgi:two-component system, OmpR family, alkaline phosphatase synthesis response regulator PhoP
MSDTVRNSVSDAARAPPSILVVEDEPDLRGLIDHSLGLLPAEISQADNGEDGFVMACENHYDLIILDVQLPRLTGFQLCEQLRARHIYTPILFLTAMREDADQVFGLEIGGDDYITKPFSLLPLQARVKSLLRRERLSKSQEVKISPISSPLVCHQLVIDPAANQAHLAGRNLLLTPKEWKLLWTLASAPGRVFSREQLLHLVWGDQYNGFEHTVNSHMNRLRAKFSEGAPSQAYIYTVWGAGYRFECPAAH